MYRAIPKRLWENPLDLNLCSTSEGELQIPFSHFVLPKSAIGSLDRNFPKFSELPTELQFRILGFCDYRTLFHLMHTSSITRSEAKRLFFSSSDTWYCINADWIFRGCFAGDTPYNVQFLPMVEQLEIQFRRMDEDHWLWHYRVTGDTVEEFQYESEEEDRAAERLEQCFHDFWQRLHTCFPRVVRVMVQCNDFLRPPCDLPPEVFKRFARTCGHDTTISFSLLRTSGRRDRQAERSIWHQAPNSMTRDMTTRWEESFDELKPRVKFLIKAFRGPLGAYQYSIHKRLQRFHLEYAIMVMLIAAIEREHFCGKHTPFQYSAPHCSAWFSSPGEFTTHVINYSEHREHLVPSEHCSLLFAEADARLEVLKHDADEADEAFRWQWGQYGTERRIATEEAALEQVVSDPLYESEKSGYES